VCDYVERCDPDGLHLFHDSSREACEEYFGCTATHDRLPQRPRESLEACIESVASRPCPEIGTVIQTVLAHGQLPLGDRLREFDLEQFLTPAADAPTLGEACLDGFDERPACQADAYCAVRALAITNAGFEPATTAFAKTRTSVNLTPTSSIAPVSSQAVRLRASTATQPAVAKRGCAAGRADAAWSRMKGKRALAPAASASSAVTAAALRLVAPLTSVNPASEAATLAIAQARSVSSPERASAIPAASAADRTSSANVRSASPRRTAATARLVISTMIAILPFAIATSAQLAIAAPVASFHLVTNAAPARPHPLPATATNRRGYLAALRSPSAYTLMTRAISRITPRSQRRT
jgi:hypothetical protein